MRSKDPIASIPVVVVMAVPAGPLHARRRWARLGWWSQVEVERIDPAAVAVAEPLLEAEVAQSPIGADVLPRCRPW